MQAVIIILIELLVTAALYGQAEEKQPAPLSVCELIARRIEYNGRLVTVRDEKKPGGHGPFLIASSDCRYKLVTRGVEWPNVIHLTYPENRSRIEEDHADFQVDWKSIRRAEDVERRSGFNRETDHIFETYVGRFVTYPDLENRVNPVRLGGSKLGFGPVGLDAPAQLLIKSIENVVVVNGTKN